MQDVNFPGTEQRSFRRKYWLLFLAIWWILSVAIAMGSITQVGVGLPELLGRITGAALFLWAIFYFAVARRAGGAAPVVSFIALLVAAALGSFAGIAGNRRHAADSIHSLNQTISQLMDTSAAARRAPGTAPTPTPSTGSGQDELSTVAEYDKVLFTKVAAISAEYARDLDSIGWSKILSADHLAKDKDLRGTRAMITAARSSLVRHSLAYNTLIGSVEHDVNQLGLPDNARVGFLKGFREAIHGHSIWEFESQSLNAFDDVVRHLESTKWQIVNQKLAFARPADLVLYRSKLAAVRAIADSEAVFTAQASARLKSGMSSVENSLK
jgi:hypothetical protein